MIPKKYIMNMIFREEAEIQRAYAAFWYLVGDEFTEIIFDENYNYLTTLWVGIEQWGGLAGGWGINVFENGNIEEGDFYELFITETQKRVDCPNIVRQPMWDDMDRKTLICKIDEWDEGGSNYILISRDGSWKYQEEESEDDEY